MKILLSLTAAAVLATSAAQAGEVSVTVEGLSSAGGTLLVALQTDAQFAKKDAAYAKTAPATGSSVTVSFDDVAAGTYAVAVVQDTDGNGDFTVGDTGPAEPWGFSGDAQSGAPQFSPAGVEVGESGTVEATVTLNQPS